MELGRVSAFELLENQHFSFAALYAHLQLYLFYFLCIYQSLFHLILNFSNLKASHYSILEDELCLLSNAHHVRSLLRDSFDFLDSDPYVPDLHNIVHLESSCEWQQLYWLPFVQHSLCLRFPAEPQRCRLQACPCIQRYLNGRILDMCYFRRRILA